MYVCVCVLHALSYHTTLRLQDRRTEMNEKMGEKNDFLKKEMPSSIPQWLIHLYLLQIKYSIFDFHFHSYTSPASQRLFGPSFFPLSRGAIVEPNRSYGEIWKQCLNYEYYEENERQHYKLNPTWMMRCPSESLHPSSLRMIWGVLPSWNSGRALEENGEILNYGSTKMTVNYIVVAEGKAPSG